MNIKGLLPVFGLVLFACNNGDNVVAGGPCSYKETIHPAKLIKLETTDSHLVQCMAGTGSRYPI